MGEEMTQPGLQPLQVEEALARGAGEAGRRGGCQATCVRALLSCPGHVTPAGPPTVLVATSVKQVGSSQALPCHRDVVGWVGEFFESVAR